MPRKTIKKDVGLGRDPIALGLAGAYIIGMLMVGLLHAMVSPISVQSNLSYNTTRASSLEKSVPSAIKQEPVRPAFGNLLTNGSFEFPLLRTESQLVTEATRQFGWRMAWSTQSNPKILSLTRQPAVEVLLAHDSWRAADGSQYARLDTANPTARPVKTPTLVTISQRVSGTPGAYTLSFDYAPEPKTSAKDNQLTVKWGGKVIANISADGSKDTVPVWKRASYSVELTSEPSLLEVVGGGAENSQGNLVDNFTLVPTLK